uniref:Uncharacterized protein n=1 Tax=Zea mays TaxID=4577 RepID=B6U5S7_MAIZE|nr:hypothetical protein [Zea mays]
MSRRFQLPPILSFLITVLISGTAIRKDRKGSWKQSRRQPRRDSYGTSWSQFLLCHSLFTLRLLPVLLSFAR